MIYRVEGDNAACSGNHNKVNQWQHKPMMISPSELASRTSHRDPPSLLLHPRISVVQPLNSSSSFSFPGSSGVSVPSSQSPVSVLLASHSSWAESSSRPYHPQGGPNKNMSFLYSQTYSILCHCGWHTLAREIMTAFSHTWHVLLCDGKSSPGPAHKQEVFT